jgi:hypothetical protein
MPDRKLMATVFWDRKGMLMVEIMQGNNTITSEEWNADIRYSATPR